MSTLGVGEKEPLTTLMQLQVCGEMRTDEQMLPSLGHNGEDGFQFNCNVAINASVLKRKLMMIGVNLVHVTLAREQRKCCGCVAFE